MLPSSLEGSHLGYALLSVVALLVAGVPFYRLVVRRLVLALFGSDEVNGKAAVRRLARVYVLLLAMVALELARATSGLSLGAQAGPWLDRLLTLAATYFAIESFRVVALDYVMVSRRKTAVPKILRDIGLGLIYLVVALVFMSQVFNINLAPILTFSGLFSIVLGMALQDTLGNLFAGLAINMEPPFAIGDWVLIEDQTAQIKEITWRATKALTRRHELIIIPNSSIGKVKIVNYSQPSSLFAHDVVVGVAYDVPPAKVIEALRSCIDQTEGILKVPAASVRLVRFADSAQEYRIRFFMDSYDKRGRLLDELLSRVWYKFQQLGYEIPYPTRTLNNPDHSTQAERERVRKLETFDRVDFLAALADDQRRNLAAVARIAQYRAGELVFSQGDSGDSLYILAEGHIELLIGVGDQAHQIAILEDGAFFGEMALLTGEPRSATAKTLTPCDIVVLTKRDLEHLFHENPEVPMEISRVIGERKAKTNQAHKRFEAALESRVAQVERDDVADQATLEIFSKIKTFFKLT